MGWLCWNIGWINSRKDIDEVFKRDVIAKDCKVLKSCCRGYTWWVAAVQDPSGDVWAVTCRYHYNPKTGDFGYKWMDESYGPGFYNYPKSYFKLLTPTTSKYANEWRAELVRRWTEKDRKKEEIA